MPAFAHGFSNVCLRRLTLNNTVQTQLLGKGHAAAQTKVKPLLRRGGSTGCWPSLLPPPSLPQPGALRLHGVLLNISTVFDDSASPPWPGLQALWSKSAVTLEAQAAGQVTSCGAWAEFSAAATELCTHVLQKHSRDDSLKVERTVLSYEVVTVFKALFCFVLFYFKWVYQSGFGGDSTPYEGIS